MRIDDAARLAGNVIGADALQDSLGIAPFDTDLAESRQIEHADVGAHCLVLGGGVVEPVLPLPAILVFRLLAAVAGFFGKIPVWPFPADGFTETGAALCMTFMQRQMANAAGGFEMAIGKVVRIEQPERLRHAIDQIGLVALKAEHAPDIDIAHVIRRFAIDHPMRQRHARAAGRLNADGIEPSRDEEIGQVRRFAEHVAVIWREALRSVEERMDAGLAQQRHPRHRLFQLRGDMIPIVRQRQEFSISGNAANAPRLGPGFEEADQQLASVFLVIGAFIRHTQHRQVFRYCGICFGDDVEMLAGLQRHIHARHAADLSPPHTGAVNDILGLNGAVVGVDSGNAPLGLRDARDSNALKECRAHLPRAFGQRQRNVGRVRLTIRRQEHTTDHTIEIDERIARQTFGRRQHMRFKPECFGHRSGAGKLFVTVFGQRQS